MKTEPGIDRYLYQIRAAPQDPAKNVGLRIVSGTAAEMRYITLLDCNIVILRFSGSDEGCPCQGSLYLCNAEVPYPEGSGSE